MAPRVDISSLKKVETEALEKLASGTDANSYLTFEKESVLKTQVYREGELLLAPFSRKPCVYFEVEALYDSPDSLFHIGNLASKEDFYVRVNNLLVKSGVPELEDLQPEFNKKYRTDELPKNVKTTLTDLGWLEKAKRFSIIKIIEKVLLPDQDYQLEVEQIVNTYRSRKISQEKFYFFYFKE